MKSDFKRNISIVCLLAGLGLVWLGAKDDIQPGDEVQSEENAEDVLADTILQIFTEKQRCYSVRVEKVSWGPEELPAHLWEQMEQWQEDENVLSKYMGYIEMLGEASGEVEEGFLWEYATVQDQKFQDTFLVMDSGIYEIRSRGDHTAWLVCMQKLLCSVPQWQITEEEAEQYVHEMSLKWEEKEMHDENLPELKLALWYQGTEYSFYGEKKRLLAYRADRECLWMKYMEDGREVERQLCCAEALPVFDTYRELREYLQLLHPDMWDCQFYTQEIRQHSEVPIIGLMTKEAEYGYYCLKGQWYQLCIRRGEGPDYSEEPYYSGISGFRYAMDYSYINSYWFHVTPQGNITEEDLLQNVFYLEQEISLGQTFSFDCRVTEEKQGELTVDSTYEVAVSVPGKDEPFQILEVHSAEWEPFSFEDFNADGFQDLTVLYYYGANGGSADHYIWSPSREEFVPAPEELSYFGQYGIDQEKRRLSIHCHGSAISGSESLYQWSGEMDCELIRHFYHGDVFDYETGEYKGMQVDVCCYENGQEKILSDYLYPMDEYMERGALWGIYSLDFVWEQEVTLEGQDGPCILRYAQENEEGYLDYLFLFREDTYLIYALEKQEASAAYTDIAWEEEGSQLAVSYEDGTTHFYRWDGTGFRSRFVGDS